MAAAAPAAATRAGRPAWTSHDTLARTATRAVRTGWVWAQRALLAGAHPIVQTKGDASDVPTPGPPAWKARPPGA